MGCCGWNADHKPPTVPSGPGATDARHLVAIHRAHAEVALHAATGGRSLCRVDGLDVGPVKSAEGGVAALGELDRELRKDPTALPGLTAEAVARWRCDQEWARSRGAAWHAYYAGGVAALEAVEAELAGTDTPSGMTFDSDGSSVRGGC